MAEHLDNGLSNRRNHSFTHHPSLETQLSRGPITPVPSWKLYHNHFYNSLSQQKSLCRSASLPHPLTRGTPLHLPAVSARKLAASFWVQHEIPLLYRYHDDGDDAVEASPLDLAEGQQPLSAQYASDESKCPSVRLSCKFLHATGMSRKAAVLPDKVTPEVVDTKSEQTTLTDGIFERLRSMQENQTVIATLRSELEDASSRLKELELSHDSAVNEIGGLLRRFKDDMTMSRTKEQEKIKSAFLHLREEMEEEKNSGRLLKIQNKKLRKELLEANRTTTTAIEELETERKARELMEDICSELAREIGEDKAEFEELKREQAEAREKVEIERKMLKMAALWREDRVRQKLSETQQELEGKNEALEGLNSKLEGFVKTLRRSGVGSLKQILELLQFEGEKWSATDPNSESPNHETHLEAGRKDDGIRQSKERENHVGGDELAHMPSLIQNSEEEGDDEVETTLEEEEEEGSKWESGDDVFTREEGDPTELEEGFLSASHSKLADKISRNSAFLKVNKLADQKREFQAPNFHSQASADSKLADEIPPNSGFLKASKLADQKHAFQAPNSQHDNRTSNFMLRNSLPAPASAQHRPLDAKKTASEPQQKASKPNQSCFRSPPRVSSSTFPRQFKASYNLQQPRRLKRNSLHVQLLEARAMENQKPVSRGLIRLSPSEEQYPGKLAC